MLELKTYKNWKEICEIMKWKTTGGTYKKARLKELESICRYRKSGNSFIIDEIYNKPLEIEDNRGGNNSKFAEHIDKLIIDECSRNNNFIEGECAINLSSSSLFLKLGMININYSSFRNNIASVSRHYEIPYETIFDFFNNTYSRNKRLLESSLNRLANKSLITWENVIKLQLDNGCSRLATDEEKRTILNAEVVAMELLGFEDKKQVFLKRKWNEFRDNVKRILKANNTGISYYYNCYHIVASTKFEKMVLAVGDKEENENELNSKIIEATRKDVVKRQNKIKDKYSMEFGKNEEPKYTCEKNILSENYLKDTKTMCNLCIDNSTSKIELDWNNISKDKFTYEESMLMLAYSLEETDEIIDDYIPF